MFAFITLVIELLALYTMAIRSLSPDSSHIQTTSGLIFRPLPQIMTYESFIHLHFHIDWPESSTSSLTNHMFYQEAANDEKLKLFATWSQKILQNVRDQFHAL